MTDGKPIARISRESAGEKVKEQEEGRRGDEVEASRRITGIIRVASDEQIISMVLHEATTASKRVPDDPVARISHGKKGPAEVCSAACAAVNSRPPAPLRNAFPSAGRPIARGARYRPRGAHHVRRTYYCYHYRDTARGAFEVPPADKSLPRALVVYAEC